MKIRKNLSLPLAICFLIFLLSINMLSAGAEMMPAGGWEFSDIAANNVTAEEQAVLDKAMENNLGINYEAKDVIATQIVAGTNYAFLCIISPIVPDPVSHWSIVTVYKDLNGNAELQNISEIAVDDVAVLSEVKQNGEGSYYSVQKEEAAPVPENVKKALDENMGLSLSSVAVLGKQVVAGTNYRILAYGTLVTAQPTTDLYIVDVYEALDGKTEITSINPFDLIKYIEKSGENEPIASDEDTDSSISETTTDIDTDSSTDTETKTNTDTDTSTDKETKTNSDKDNTDTAANNNDVKSPKTGYNDNFIFVIALIGLIMSSSAASAYYLYKKHE